MIYGGAGVAPRVELEGSATASWARTAHALIEFIEHYHQARPHQGVGQRPPSRGR